MRLKYHACVGYPASTHRLMLHQSSCRMYLVGRSGSSLRRTQWYVRQNPRAGASQNEDERIERQQILKYGQRCHAIDQCTQRPEEFRYVCPYVNCEATKTVQRHFNLCSIGVEVLDCRWRRKYSVPVFSSRLVCPCTHAKRSGGPSLEKISPYNLQLPIPAIRLLLLHESLPFLYSIDCHLFGDLKPFLVCFGLLVRVDAPVMFAMEWCRAVLQVDMHKLL